MEQSISDERDKKRRFDLATSCESDDCKVAQHSDDQAPSKKTITDEARAQQAASDADDISIGTNSQWLLSRNGDPQIVLHDNLGDASAMVESLTHRMDNWSITKQSSSSSSSSKTKKNDKAYKQKCKAAKREVMRSMLKKSDRMNR
ncbi:unnamed protein product [Cylindrotheca closterium]|uniref:Uncharacterized protein n=1 Tax=Cylindrotheca closterium TaxID=2856 RepID=A0AAD2CM64_9STRA|nr:unnamed protein product [Cylindrotheca closterium]